MIYAMEYYGNNDYRDYLEHYGVKGMKWGKHLFGLLGGNYRDQYRSYSSKAPTQKKFSNIVSGGASNASSYASKKKKEYESITSKANHYKNISRSLSNTSNKYSAKASEMTNAARKASEKKRISATARANEVLMAERRRRELESRMNEQRKYRDKMDSIAPPIYDFKTFAETGKKEPIKSSKPTSYDSKDRVNVRINNTSLSLRDIPKNVRNAINDSRYGAAIENKRKYDSYKRTADKAKRDAANNNGVNKLINKAKAHGYKTLGERISKASDAMVAKSKNDYERASANSKKANDLANNVKAKADKTEQLASKAKSKWEKSAANKISQVLKRFTGALSSVGANIINRGRSIIDRFLRRKKKNS